jgi:hypothetical protein
MRFSPLLAMVLAIGSVLPRAAFSGGDAQGTSKGAQVAQAGLSAGGMVFGTMMMSKCTPQTATFCVLGGLGFAAGALSGMLSGANGGAANNFNGGGFGDLGDYDFDDPNFTMNDLVKDPNACLDPSSNPTLCKPGGYKETKDKLINDLNARLKDGTLKGDDALKVQGILDAVAAGDSGKLQSIVGESGDGLAGMEEYIPEGGGDPNALAGGDATFSGEEAVADGGGSGSDGKGKGNSHIDGSLVDTDWNGLLDMIDSNSGKSLTLWQRATRRYQGGPKGRRALTMARMEHIRKTAIAKLKSQKGTPSAAVALRKPLEKSAAADRKPSSLPSRK